MPRANDAALEKGECRLYGIGMNLSHNIDVTAVVNRFVRNSSSLSCVRVRSKIIGNDHVHIGLDVLSDILGERSSFYIIGMEQPQIAIALPNPNHDFFVVILRRMALAYAPTADV